ncbi:MAG TPA: aldo/keto reductase, partial [Candidatus Hydrogenedentes bacterium]|nr:aldo/keto reductase [Candidatus Hydrogenedentota bacterium]
MLYRTLGKSGLNVSVIAFGAWQIGDPEFWGDDPQADPDGVVGAAIDAGINLFDTAELYGNGRSEEVLGKALQGRREQVFIASKAATQHCNADDLREACENSLRRLGTDRIDLYQVHWPLPHRFNEAIIPILERLRIEGKIREIGVSNFGPQDIEAWMGSGTAVSDQIGYNLLFRSPEYEMIPACRRHHLGVLAYMPLMQGLLSGRYSDLDSIPMKRRRSRHFSGVREGTRHEEEGHERVLRATLEALLDFSEAIHIPLATVSLAWLISQPG